MYTKNIDSLLNKIQNIDGDIIELGVYKGNNTFIIGDFLQKNKLNKQYIGFDTFNGYCEEDLVGANEGALSNQRSERWKISKTLVVDAITEKVLDDYCQIVVGDIKSTIHKYLNTKCESYKISMIYIDCNLYLPAIVALRACKNYLSRGALVVVDEHTIGGETQAFNEFCQEMSIDVHSTGWVYPYGPRIYGIVK